MGVGVGTGGVGVWSVGVWDGLRGGVGVVDIVGVAWGEPVPVAPPVAEGVGSVVEGVGVPASKLSRPPPW